MMPISGEITRYGIIKYMLQLDLTSDLLCPEASYSPWAFYLHHLVSKAFVELSVTRMWAFWGHVPVAGMGVGEKERY